MDLFEYNLQKRGTQDAPLAARMRPTTLEEFVGQEQIVGKDKLLYRAIKGDRLGSLIFYGPPGTGKTTLAKIIANTTKRVCPDQRYHCRHQRHQRYGDSGKRTPWYVWQKDHPFYRRNPSFQ